MWKRFDERELATVLAGLRYWQREGLNSDGAEGDIATDGGTLSMMQPDEIDTLCERLNETEDAAGWIAQAREQYASDEINIDDDAVLSEGDEGAFVSAWVWVSNEDMGIDPDEDDQEGTTR